MRSANRRGPDLERIVPGVFDAANVAIDDATQKSRRFITSSVLGPPRTHVTEWLLAPGRTSWRLRWLRGGVWRAGPWCSRSAAPGGELHPPDQRDPRDDEPASRAGRIV